MGSPGDVWTVTTSTRNVASSKWIVATSAWAATASMWAAQVLRQRTKVVN